MRKLTELQLYTTANYVYSSSSNVKERVAMREIDVDTLVSTLTRRYHIDDAEKTNIFL